ncbi:MAG: DoxX family protein [Filimonas sp.]|nr:DoxX family protein [Filimonas sp.]
MESNVLISKKAESKKTVWTGRVITILCVLFLLFDAIMKIVEEKHSVDGSVALGWPVDGVQGLGIVLLLATVLYVIPRTAFIGALLITGYLGGAIAVMVRTGTPYYFPVIFSLLVWCGLALRDARLRAYILGNDRK